MIKAAACLQLAAVITEFLLPWILKRFYPGYDSRKMAMSILGSPSSPVSSIYSAWLVVLGLTLSLASSVYFSVLSEKTVLAVLTSVSIFLFALGAGILAGIFKADADDKIGTLPSRIHGYSSAIGFMALLFFPLLRSAAMFEDSFPLLRSAAMFEDRHFMLGASYLTVFLFALLFFILFIMSDKEQYNGTCIDREGTWERLTLFFMYLPLVADSLIILIPITA